MVVALVTFMLTSCVREYKEEGPNKVAQTSNTHRNAGANRMQTKQAAGNAGGASAGGASAGVDANYTIDRKGNYYQELRKGLGLTRPQMNQVKGIAENFRKQIKAAGPTSKKGLALKAERNNKLLTVLSKGQMEQKKYLDAVYFGFSTESPAHPVNLKRSLAISDSKMLQILAAQSDFKAVRARLGKNVDPKAPQLMKALEKRNNALQEILSPEQFVQYRKAMKAAYSVAG